MIVLAAMIRSLLIIALVFFFLINYFVTYVYVGETEKYAGSHWFTQPESHYYS